MPEQQYDLIVIGAGPGGYVAAIRAAQLGMKVLVVEKRSVPGGVCLNEGCIPSKALLESSEHFAMAGRDLARRGVIVDAPRLDLKVMMERKAEIVAGLAAGVSFLLKKMASTFYMALQALLTVISMVITGFPSRLAMKVLLIVLSSSVKQLIALSQYSLQKESCWLPAVKQCHCRACPLTV